MSSLPNYEKDLIVLVADLDMEMAVKGILSRTKSLGIRDVTFDPLRCTGHDPDALNRNIDYLRPYLRSHAYSLVMMDRAGCGKENQSRQQLENDLETQLSQNGWAERTAAIVIDPELEAWVWSSSSRVPHILGWQNKKISLRKWLEENNLWDSSSLKPQDPKTAMQEVIKYCRKPSSAATFESLAKNVSMQKCSDPSFQKLKNVLQKWFSTPD